MNNTEDTWVEQGQEITNTTELHDYIAAMRINVHHMQTGLSRAASGALSGRAWVETPGAEREGHDDLLHSLDMTVTPSGMAAKDATYRQALATLVAALDTVDRATLGAWLAHVNAADPHRPA